MQIKVLMKHSQYLLLDIFFFKEIVPDVAINLNKDFGSIQLYDFDFNGIKYNEVDCELDFKPPSIQKDIPFDFKFEFYFDLYEFLDIEDDGVNFVGELCW